jgi:hypothetical protein
MSVGSARIQMEHTAPPAVARISIENLRKYGGTLTSQSHIGQINEIDICALIEIKTMHISRFIL